jgi:hypothetical protein
MQNIQELPQYKCHKIVRAAKIQDLHALHDGAARLVPERADLEPFEVSRAFVARHLESMSYAEIRGGWFVVYDDGYQSFSPASAFEQGYTPLGEVSEDRPQPKTIDSQRFSKLQNALAVLRSILGQGDAWDTPEWNEEVIAALDKFRAEVQAAGFLVD